QERLAELLGVTFQQVQKYEKGINRIAATRLFAIANSLDVTIGSFFDGFGGRASGVAEEPAGFVNDVLATPEGVQLVALFGAIKNARVRKRVVELVKAIAEEGPGAEE